MWRGGLGAAYLLPALSSAGASIASPCFRFHIPLIGSSDSALIGVSVKLDPAGAVTEEPTVIGTYTDCL